MSAQVVWVVWLVTFLAFEMAAAATKKKGDTLSETTWKWFAVKGGKFHLIRQGILLGFMLSLTVHLVFATSVLPLVFFAGLFILSMLYSLWKERG